MGKNFHSFLPIRYPHYAIRILTCLLYTSKDPENRVEELRLEAIDQANRYADTDTVKSCLLYTSRCV